MEKISLSSKKILDIGSGSGILSIAAKCFGANEIYALDNDYLAINSTESNFLLNFGTLDDLKTYLGPFDSLVSKYTLKNFDFILCNILAEVIKIDPGAAFGTGSHPTTSLCLEQLEKISLSNNKILDIGSGSGILSIAAKCFGANEIYALDNDYLAINSTDSNLSLIHI